jgi:hypothetical protein
VHISTQFREHLVPLSLLHPTLSTNSDASACVQNTGFRSTVFDFNHFRGQSGYLGYLPHLLRSIADHHKAMCTHFWELIPARLHWGQPSDIPAESLLSGNLPLRFAPIILDVLLARLIRFLSFLVGHPTCLSGCW